MCGRSAHLDWLRLAVLSAALPCSTAATLPSADIAALRCRVRRSSDRVDGLLVVRPLDERRTAGGNLRSGY